MLGSIGGGIAEPKLFWNEFGLFLVRSPQCHTNNNNKYMDNCVQFENVFWCQATWELQIGGEKRVRPVFIFMERLKIGPSKNLGK